MRARSKEQEEYRQRWFNMRSTELYTISGFGFCETQILANLFTFKVDFWYKK